MMVIFLLTMLVVVIPTLHVLNARSVQKIALFIGVSQMALLALTGKIDHQLSDFFVSTYNQAVSASVSVIIQKLVCLFTV